MNRALALGHSQRWPRGMRDDARASIAGGARSGPEDRVGIDDTFDVRVYGETELSGTFRVATDGTIDYPLARPPPGGWPADRRDSAAAGDEAQGPVS